MYRPHTTHHRLHAKCAGDSRLASIASIRARPGWRSLQQWSHPEQSIHAGNESLVLSVSECGHFRRGSDNHSGYNWLSLPLSPTPGDLQPYIDFSAFLGSVLFSSACSSLSSSAILALKKRETMPVSSPFSVQDCKWRRLAALCGDEQAAQERRLDQPSTGPRQVVSADHARGGNSGCCGPNNQHR